MYKIDTLQNAKESILDALKTHPSIPEHIVEEFKPLLLDNNTAIAKSFGKYYEVLKEQHGDLPKNSSAQSFIAAFMQWVNTLSAFIYNPSHRRDEFDYVDILAESDRFGNIKSNMNQVVHERVDAGWHLMRSTSVNISDSAISQYLKSNDDRIGLKSMVIRIAFFQRTRYEIEWENFPLQPITTGYSSPFGAASIWMGAAPPPAAIYGRPLYTERGIIANDGFDLVPRSGCNE